MNGTLKLPSVRYAVSALALLGAALMQPAHADQVTTTLVPPESIFFVGSEESTVLSLNTTGAGTVTVNVNDFEWPVALQSLSFSFANDSQVLQAQTQANPQKDFTISYNVGGAGAFFAQISAIAGASQFAAFPAIGAYSLDVTFTPQQVTAAPLPPAVWLLVTGLLGLAGVAVARRGRGFPVPGSVSPTPVC
jgi:hypothetical protein